MNQTERRRFLIDALLDERPEYRGARVPADGEEQRLLLRALMNVRTARGCSPDFLRVQDEYLRAELEAKGITDVDSLRPVRNGLESVAFCCISTGEFHFPNERAAEIAVKTAEDFMQRESSVRRVIFNVFKDRDEKIYRKLLGADRAP